MKKSLPYLIIIGAAILQGFGQPLIPSFGISIPLTLIALALIGSNRDKMEALPWVGFVGGITLEFTTINILGTQALFYFAVAATFNYICKALNLRQNRWWLQSVYFIVIAAILPWYLLLINGQFNLNLQPIIAQSVVNMLAIGAIATGPYWLTSRRIESSRYI